MEEAPPLSRFETVARELRVLGITLTRLPGEYRVNYLDGKDGTAVFGSDLDEALALGRSMAEAAPAAVVRAAAAYHRRRHRKMTPKAIRRRMIRAHNRRMRARAIRQQREDA